MTDTSKALEPCPFCGSTNIGENYVETFSTDSSYNTFGCLDCGANFHESDGGSEAWNKRTNRRLAAVESELAALKEALRGLEPVHQICKTDSVALHSAWVDVDEVAFNDAALYPEFGRRALYTLPPNLKG